MKAVRSMEIRGTISMSCWHAISSSSGGVTDVRRDWGRDIASRSMRKLNGPVIGCRVVCLCFALFGNALPSKSLVM